YDYWFPGRQVERLYDAAVADSVTRPLPPTINARTRDEWLANTHSLFGRRFKGHLEPRIQVSHPISRTSNLFFNYGHFSQRPAYFYVYAKTNAQSSEEFPRIGNPDLNPEVAVQYELGVNHQFAPDKAVKVVVYNKDIYDYPTSTTLTLTDRGTRRADFFVYRNLDYARSRGVEIEVRKQRTNHTSWAVSYTFSNAKGKSSDPNNLSVVRESGGDARETALEEEYMWWNRPHKVTSWFTYQIPRGDTGGKFLGLRLPQDLKLNAYFMMQSGRAYTPEDVFGNFTDVAYSKNGPFDSSLNATLVKGFQLGSRHFELTLQGWNLLNRRNATDFDPVTGERWKPGQGSLGVNPLDDPASLQLSDVELAEVANVHLDVNRDDPRLNGLPPGSAEYEQVYSELEAEAAALVAPGLRRQVIATINRYSDPSMIAAPRHVRVSIGMEW
ncbi:MAG: TonB-dependent receptor, partial [Candidatus Eisenbacteria bacterium]|nr:TonB-dependent receptor [Candidatus Eisenbacteria bacterium]